MLNQSKGMLIHGFCQTPANEGEARDISTNPRHLVQIEGDGDVSDADRVETWIIGMRSNESLEGFIEFRTFFIYFFITFPNNFVNKLI